MTKKAKTVLSEDIHVDEIFCCLAIYKWWCGSSSSWLTSPKGPSGSGSRRIHECCVRLKEDSALRTIEQDWQENTDLGHSLALALKPLSMLQGVEGRKVLDIQELICLSIAQSLQTKLLKHWKFGTSSFYGLFPLIQVDKCFTLDIRTLRWQQSSTHCTHIHMHRCTTRTHARMHAPTQSHTHTCTHTCTHTNTHIPTCSHTDVHTHTCTQTRANIHTVAKRLFGSVSSLQIMQL